MLDTYTYDLIQYSLVYWSFYLLNFNLERVIIIVHESKLKQNYQAHQCIVRLEMNTLNVCVLSSESFDSG